MGPIRLPLPMPSLSISLTHTLSPALRFAHSLLPFVCQPCLHAVPCGTAPSRSLHNPLSFVRVVVEHKRLARLEKFKTSTFDFDEYDTLELMMNPDGNDDHQDQYTLREKLIGLDGNPLSAVDLVLHVQQAQAILQVFHPEDWGTGVRARPMSVPINLRGAIPDARACVPTFL